MPVLTPDPDRAPPHHAVQFYRDSGFLCAAVATFLGEGLANGQPGLVIATPAHRAGIAEQLAVIGIDADDARRTGDLVMLDATQLLSTFMVDDRPDPDRFRRNVVPVVERLLARCAPTIRAYGEMVDVLWGNGQPDAALRLEALWNELAESCSFALLCGYAAEHFRAPHADGMAHICRQHTAVLCMES